MQTIRRFAATSSIVLVTLAALGAFVVGAMLAVAYARDADDPASVGERLERVFSGDSGGVGAKDAAEEQVLTDRPEQPGPVVGDPDALARWEMTSEEWAAEVARLMAEGAESVLDGLCVVSRNLPYGDGGFDAVFVSIDDEELFRISCNVHYDEAAPDADGDENRLPALIEQRVEDIVRRSMSDFDAGDYEWPFSFHFRSGGDDGVWHQTDGFTNPWLGGSVGGEEWLDFVWDGGTRNFAIPGVDYFGPEAATDGDGDDGAGEWCISDDVVRELLPGIDTYGEEWAECVTPGELATRLLDRDWIGGDLTERDWTGFYWADGEPFQFGPGIDGDDFDWDADGMFEFDWERDAPFAFGSEGMLPFGPGFGDDGRFQFRQPNGEPFDCDWVDGWLECSWEEGGAQHQGRWRGGAPFWFGPEGDLPFGFEWDDNGSFRFPWLEYGEPEFDPFDGLTDDGFDFDFDGDGDGDDAAFEFEWGKDGPCRSVWDSDAGWRLEKGDESDPTCVFFGPVAIRPVNSGDSVDRDAALAQLKSMYNIDGVGRDEYFARLFPDGSMTEPWITPEVRAELERLLDRSLESSRWGVIDEFRSYLDAHEGTAGGG